jgi:hypothetical protein
MESTGHIIALDEVGKLLVEKNCGSRRAKRSIDYTPKWMIDKRGIDVY